MVSCVEYILGHRRKMSDVIQTDSTFLQFRMTSFFVLFCDVKLLRLVRLLLLSLCHLYTLNSLILSYTIPQITYSIFVRSFLLITFVSLLLIFIWRFSLRSIIFATMSLFLTKIIRVVTWPVPTCLLVTRTPKKLFWSFDFSFLFISDPFSLCYVLRLMCKNKVHVSLETDSIWHKTWFIFRIIILLSLILCIIDSDLILI